MPIPSGQLRHSVTVIPFSSGVTGDGDQYFSNATSGTSDISCLLITDQESEQLTFAGQFAKTYMKLMYLPTVTIQRGYRVNVPPDFVPFGTAFTQWEVIRGPQDWRDLGANLTWFNDVIIELVR